MFASKKQKIIRKTLTVTVYSTRKKLYSYEQMRKGLTNETKKEKIVFFE